MPGDDPCRSVRRASDLVQTPFPPVNPSPPPNPLNPPISNQITTRPAVQFISLKSLHFL